MSDYNAIESIAYAIIYHSLKESYEEEHRVRATTDIPYRARRALLTVAEERTRVFLIARRMEPHGVLGNAVYDAGVYEFDF